MKRSLLCTVLLTLLLLPVCPGRAQVVPGSSADSLLSCLTLRQKARLVVGGGYGSLLSGFGIPFCRGTVPGAAGETSRLRKQGIGPIILSDGPAGLRLKESSTAFPVGSLLACTWDTALVARVGEAMGREARSKGVDVILAPGMNLMRNPLCGRNFEYYSEDPLLTGWMATAMVRGIQSAGVGACVKHFVANNQETNRKHNNSKVSLQPLRELYLKPFEMVVREAAPWTVMSSYNLLNGELTQQSHALLTEVLREEWGFDGLVMTDWTGKRRSALQIQAGNDLLMPGLGRQRREILRAVRRGRLCECELDMAVSRVLQLVGKSPCHGIPQPSPVAETPGAMPAGDVAREAAAAGMVLLENRDCTLPLQLADRRIALFGATSYEMIIGGTGSGHVKPSHTTGLMEALVSEGARPDSSLTRHYQRYIARRGHRYPSAFYLSRYLGKGGLKECPMNRDTIVQVADRTDLALITLGRQAGEGKDRSLKDDFLLTSAEQSLVRDVTDAYHRQGKRVIVILNVGGVIETDSWKDLPDAILLAWSPGQEGGAAVADLLTGRVNPSGRLTMTWPLRYGDHPSSRNFPEGGKGRRKDGNAGRPDIDYTDYAEGMDVGYRYFHDHQVPVSYPFGYGLSYSHFTRSAPRVSQDAAGNLLADVTVTNEGQLPGRTVVQLYGKPSTLPTSLLAFGKTPLLDPGETYLITLRLPAWLVPGQLDGFWVK